MISSKEERQGFFKKSPKHIVPDESGLLMTVYDTLIRCFSIFLNQLI